MPETTQNYSNHTRWHPPFHFFLFPVFTIHLAWSIYKLTQALTLDNIEQLLLAAALIVLFLLVRTNALKVQDRLIRLEEQLRYQRLLPADLAAKAGALPVRFIVALRFASDEELPGLVKQVIDRKFAKPVEVKRAIQNWRGDFLRV
jgi:hypothetical protein